ncbi:C6 finger domain-containing protein [Apiospora arundinis]
MAAEKSISTKMGEQAFTPLTASSGTPTSSSSPTTASSPTSASSYVEVNGEALQCDPTRDVAIVGMSCRTAGGLNSPEKLWDFLMDKKDASGEVPRHRWEPWMRRDPRNKKEIEQTVSRGYFIEDLENFDAAFFGISPKEANQMDPHQRLGLELAWEALENAGIDPHSLAESDTAVYMGCDSDDYSRLLMEDLPNIEPWMGIGTAPHGIPNRISYHLNLMGPSAAVDAACASGLVAIHMGCRAILDGESTVALVGGVNVLLSPGLTRMLGKAGALSPEGICRSFDDDANGYARGEGGAVVVLKNLAAAIADGDHILAVTKGSAVAQDGKTNGIMAPNAKAQELVGRQALERARLAPSAVDYVEAHATSTKLGDPTEVSALAALYGAGAGRDQASPVYLGSIKPNVGHLEAAAGAIGFVKAVLAVNKGQLAPQAKLNKLNSRVDWANSGLQVVRDAMAWPTHKKTDTTNDNDNDNSLTNMTSPRTAAVCCYGYGGTVAHALGPTILPVSASQLKRLAPRSKQLAEWLSEPANEAYSLRDIAHTLSRRRAHHPHRAAVVVESHQEASDAMSAVAADECDGKDHIAFGGRVLGTPTDRATDVVWVFSGHGAQWKDMGTSLLRSRVFAEFLRELDGLVQKEAGFSALEALRTGDFEESTERVQVLTYVVQVGLHRLLRSEGVAPQAVIGHSVGEVAASVVAGCLDVEEGLLLVARRAKLYADLRTKVVGAMALVQLPFSQVSQELTGREQDIVAAIDSSPSSCVVSGKAESVDEFVQQLKTRGVKTFRVNTDVAFHSPMLEDYSAPLAKVLEGSMHPHTPTIPAYSTSAADPRAQILRGVEYWQNNMVGPVMLQSAVKAALDDGYRIFLEISSHPILLHSLAEIVSERGLNEDDFLVAATMKRGKPVLGSVRNAIARLYTAGATVDWTKQLGRGGNWCQDVPVAPWLHKFYYQQVETAPQVTSERHNVDEHTILGQRTDIAGTDVTVFTTKLNDQTKPYPGLHPLEGTEIIPAGLRIPVSMGPDTRDVQVIVQGDRIRVASSAERTEANNLEPSWVTHSASQWEIPKSDEHVAQEPIDIQTVQKRIGTVLPNDFVWEFLKKIGVEGIAFPWQVIEHYGNSNEMMVKVDMDPSIPPASWEQTASLAPMFDAATSVGSAIFFDDIKLKIVSGIKRVDIWSDKGKGLPKIGYLYITRASDAKGPKANIDILDVDGTKLARISSMIFSEVEGARGVSGTVDGLVHRMVWIPPKFAETPRDLGNVLLVAAHPEHYITRLRYESKELLHISSAQELEGSRADEALSLLAKKGSTVIYVPSDAVASVGQVPAAAQALVCEATALVKFLASAPSRAKDCRLFIVTRGVRAGEDATGLAHGPLHGLARIIGSEHPDVWGGLTDTDPCDDGRFPFLALKYVKGQDVLHMTDGLPRRPMLRPLTRDLLHKADAPVKKTLLPKPEGTYVFTGGLGDLALETCDFLAKKGARRFVLVSRRRLPGRRQWDALVAANDAKWASIITRIRALESLGATVLTVALDVSDPQASEKLLDALDNLGLPPVLGVVHAAGVPGGSMLMDTTPEAYHEVFSPKVDGAVALHKAFPPGTLDFFVSFSSIGQLVGMEGQAAYASANAFLDALTTLRRNAGDNAVAFQYTVWEGLGMVKDLAALESQFRALGVTTISPEEAYCAWEHVNKYDVEGAVVSRLHPIAEDESVPIPMFEDVIIRKSSAAYVNNNTKKGEELDRSMLMSPPPTPPNGAGGLDSRVHLALKLRECIASVLMMPDIEDIEVNKPLSDFGVDSVMTVVLRQKLQKAFGIKLPATLTWNYPTVNHLVGWFAENLNAAAL